MSAGSPWYETAVERQIREAQERGDFDDLPGAGKPLDLGDLDDPDWWVKRMARREQLDLGAALPGALGLRKEAAGYPESLLDLNREAQVREVLVDYNRRVIEDRRRPVVGNLPPTLARIIDVDEMVDRWRVLHDERVAAARDRAAAAAAERQAADEAARTARRDARWWRRLTRRVR
ncbi:uncharacterized protein DUF1992 [Terracoccus luteus]|jgi:hypothetical protein|uniref:Uncharacterized protein DUF1992 n=1 Tax=Terracoccus luteus TaxID=53356 RepID=A0A495Y292_9MICO|nr:DUF1992 domain-containing protein [Terracoccus luteus]RKT79364.1 uncharacterized protein DUF1992 [Terracoccus luteus]